MPVNFGISYQIRAGLLLLRAPVSAALLLRIPVFTILLVTLGVLFLSRVVSVTVLLLRPLTTWPLGIVVTVLLITASVPLLLRIVSVSVLLTVPLVLITPMITVITLAVMVMMVYVVPIVVIGSLVTVIVSTGCDTLGRLSVEVMPIGTIVQLGIAVVAKVETALRPWVRDPIGTVLWTDVVGCSLKHRNTIGDIYEAVIILLLLRLGIRDCCTQHGHGSEKELRFEDSMDQYKR